MGLVWIYNSELCGFLYVYLGAALTDGNGYFTFGPMNNDDEWLEDEYDIVICVAAANSAAQVIDDEELYDGWTAEWSKCPDDILDIGNWGSSA